MLHQRRKTHIVLTSHPHSIYKQSPVIQWGARDAQTRGPVVASLTDRLRRNAIGTHGGSYTVYRALAAATGQMPPDHRPDLTNTTPAERVGPFPAWTDPEKIVSLDPWGASVAEVFAEQLRAGYDIRPTIAVTQAHLKMPEVTQAIETGRIRTDGKIVLPSRDVVVTKMAIEPVWYLSGIAKRFSIDEMELRKSLFEDTGGMFPELVSRPDLKLLLPPIGSNTVYLFGDPSKLGNPETRVTCRVHDECNGSDVFGSDICTCRPYLVQGIEAGIEEAQRGGLGVVVYYRKEGRALGEVTKFLVYNARKRQEGGDSASTYFLRTECVAGVQDMRFQELMPDTLHWLGISRIDRLISMSNMKFDAIAASGIEVRERVEIPHERIPEDARVEMEAKKAAGYFAEKTGTDPAEKLTDVKGRRLTE